MKLYKNLNAALKEPAEVLALKVTLKNQNEFDQILNFVNLRELYLEGDCEFLPAHFPWKDLKIISLKFNHFKDQVTPLFSLPKLENLKVIETPIKNVLLPIGHSVSPIKILTLKDCAIESLPEEISMFIELRELYLPKNKLKTLPVSFQFLKNLKRLNLDSNDFSKFPDIIQKLKNLSHLSIDNNHFSEDEKARIQREFNIWL